MEKDLQVQEPLDEAYDRAAELAKLAEQAKENPEAVLKELEKELPKNPDGTTTYALQDLARVMKLSWGSNRCRRGSAP